MPTIYDPQPTGLRIPSEKGKAPDTRIRNAYQVWSIADELNKQDDGRRKKRGRIYKAYHRFPPKEYSKLFQEGMDWQSNVPFGMLSYTVDNQLSSFFDMVTERVWAADIKTKKGKPRERQEWSEHISAAFDKVLREWDDFLLNVEQDLLDMLLFGKGIQIWEDEEGAFSEHVPADDFLVPDGTKVSFSNFEECAIRKSYTVYELWKKIEKGAGEERGWNRKAVLDAIRYSRDEWKKTDEKTWLNDVQEGNIVIGSHLKEHIHTYMVFVKQFSGKIGKYIVLQDYKPMRSKEIDAMAWDEEKKTRATVKKTGFLFSKDEFSQSADDVFSVFMDTAGSGRWHGVTSLAEKIFVQCRQYDFTMNAIMDAVKINMTLLLQATSADASEKLKSLVFGPFTIIPSDVPFVQQRVALPTQEATAAVQFMMLDMFRGIGEYRIHERGGGGEAVTATQNANDTAEAAKLSGTQLKRYNEQHTKWYRRKYKRLVNLTEGERDYEHLQKFKDYLKEKKVPNEAWAEKNIESIHSNMLAGAGSPSYKLMAARETIGILNVSPKDEGQRNAQKDAIAALQGRGNVDRYISSVKPDKTWNERAAGYENEMLANPLLNPANVQVMPEDNDLEHLDLHLGDMEATILLVNEKIKQGSVQMHVADAAIYRLGNVGGHANAHIKNLQRDEGKKEDVKAIQQRLNQIQHAADDMRKQLQKATEQANAQYDPSTDPEMARKLAHAQLEIDTKQKLANIKLSANAASHAQRSEITKDKAANDIAINRAKELDKIETKRKAEAKAPAKKPTK